MKKKIFLVLGLFTMGLMSVAFVSTIKTTDLSVLIGNLEAVAAGDAPNFKKKVVFETGKVFKITEITGTVDGKYTIGGIFSEDPSYVSAGASIKASSEDGHLKKCEDADKAQEVTCSTDKKWKMCNSSNCLHE